jgi:hypothetical protein
MSIINGSMEASTQWNISLAPKKIGKALIPSFNINGAVSDAIEMTIEGKSRTQATGNDDITVVTEIDQSSPLVQQQLIMTVRLYTTVSLTGAELDPLELKDAIVVKLEDKQYQTKIHGKPGAVIESRFAIYPQKSGELTIPSLLYQVAVNNGARDMWNDPFGRNSNKVLRYRTDEKTLNVSPTPSSLAGAAWLPAKNLTLSEHWNLDVDNLKVGEPVSRSITIKAEGLTAAQISPLPDTQINHLTFYKDQAQSDDQKSDKGVVGTRIETTAIVPTQAGKYQLPEVTLKWWNTETQAFETASLPPVTLTVASDAMTNLNGTNTGASPAVEPSDSVPINTDLSTLAAPTTAIKETPLWLYATNILTLLGLIFLGWKNWILQRKLTQINSLQAQRQAELTQKESAAWQQLKQSIAENNLPQVRTHILHWAQIHWGNPQLSSLQALGDQLHSPELSTQLSKLDQAIYRNVDSQLNNSELLAILSNLRRDKTKKATTQDELQPLYKN